MNGSVLYRARRLRFIVAALLVIPFTILVAWLAYEGVVLGDEEVRGAWLAIPLLGLYLWFDYVVMAKLVRPPELEVSLNGIRWANYAMLQWPTYYAWQDIDGPQQAKSPQGVPLLQFVVKASGKKLKLPPSHFGATYDEMAAVITAARKGDLISPPQWRLQNPDKPMRRWLIDWGVPIAIGAAIAIALGWLTL
jgi:hypothetical protein